MISSPPRATRAVLLALTAAYVPAYAYKRGRHGSGSPGVLVRSWLAMGPADKPSRVVTNVWPDSREGFVALSPVAVGTLENLAAEHAAAIRLVTVDFRGIKLVARELTWPPRS